MNSNFNHLEHLNSTVALFLGFFLTILGIFWLLSSQDLDAQGLSRPLPFTFGAVTCYLALSQTLTAFMHEYLIGVESVIKTALSIHAANTGSLSFSEDNLILVLVFIGGAIWSLTTYIAPIMISYKSPITQQQRRWVVGYYLALQIPIYWVYAQVWNIQYAATDPPLNSLHIFALQFFQPLLWF
ncbi:hypothetical protein [Methyloprofundus sp.]|uniref:hypothetical protein n=1 Tax=Methyloprofundus sp. TaxID=2020875 RepID=UPI003D13E75D